MTSPRYRTTSWNGLENFECTVCPFTTLDRGKMVNHVRDHHPTAAELGHDYDEDPLEGIPFASGSSEELARGNGLTRADLAGHTFTGSTGYTSADVRAIVGGRSDSSEDSD